MDMACFKSDENSVQITSNGDRPTLETSAKASTLFFAMFYNKKLISDIYEFVQLEDGRQIM